MTIERNEGSPSRSYLITEVYFGTPPANGGKLYIPNVGDLIIDYERGFYRVSNISSNGIPQLEKWDPTKLGEVAEDQDLDAGLSRNYAKGTNRAFANYSVSPPTLTLDMGAYIYGSEAVKFKIFRGTNTEADGEVISRLYDSNNNFISDTIDLVRLDPNNASIKRAPSVKVDVQLDEGETVTLVAFSTNGGPVYKEVFTARLTDSIQPASEGNKYLVDISLVSDLIDPDDPTRILNDLNVPFATTLMSCKLHYNDGSSQVIGIDGNKVKFHGVQNFNESIMGPPTTVILSYQPSAEEKAINVTNGNTPTLTKAYKLANRRGEATFGFKLMVIPEYQDVSLGYRLRYFLTNFNYDIKVEVTQHVSTTRSSGGAWSPTAFEVKQTLMAILRLDDVFPGIYDGYIHVQEYDIVLAVPTISGGNSWIIDYQGDGDRSLGFGVDVEASNLNRRMTIQNGHINQSDWLDKLYYESTPLFDSELVGAPPIPTHFTVFYGGTSIRYPVANWANYLYTNNEISFTQYETAIIRWEATDGEVTKYLAYVPLLVRVVD